MNLFASVICESEGCFKAADAIGDVQLLAGLVVVLFLAWSWDYRNWRK